MASPANPNGPPESTIAGQDSGEPKLDKTDPFGILKQRLVNIAKDKHERLIKGVEGVLQTYASGIEADLTYIINEYTTVKRDLEKLNNENMLLKAVNATMSDQLISAQHNRQGSGSSANDKAAIENLRLELDITTRELSRALEDVENLKAQRSQVEVAIQHKDVVNHQLAVIIDNRQLDLDLKQKENTRLTAQLIDARAKLVQAMGFVGHYYPVLEPEVMKRKALHEQQQQQLQQQQHQQHQHQQQQQPQQQQHQQQQQQQGFPRPAVPAQMLNGLVGHFSQGPSTSPVSPSSHHPAHMSSQSLKWAASPIHQGHPHQPLSVPPLKEPSTPASSTSRMPPAQLGIVSPTVTAPPVFPSTGSSRVSTASLLQQVKSQIEANSTQRQGQDRKFQDLKRQAAIVWREKNQQQESQQIQSETAVLGAPQYPSQQPVPPVTQQHQLQQQQLQLLQQQQLLVQLRRQQEQPMIQEYQQQQVHRLINPSTSQDQDIGPTSSQRLPEPQHPQSWSIGPKQDPTSRASNAGPVLGNTVSSAEPISRPISNSTTPSSTPVVATIDPAPLLSASTTSPAEPGSLSTPVLADETAPIALESESTSTSTEPAEPTESTEPAEPMRPTAPTAGSTKSATASPSPSPSPEPIAAPIAATLMSEAVAEPTTAESSTTAALPELPFHSTKLPFSGMISQSPSEQPTQPTQGLAGNRKRGYESAILLEETDDEGEHINANADKGHDYDEGFSQPTLVDFDFDHDWAPPPPPHKRLQTLADKFKPEPGKWYMSSVHIPAFSPSRSGPVVDNVTRQRRRIVIDDESDDNEDVFVDVNDSFESTSNGVRSSSSPSKAKSTVKEIHHTD
ncbi:hypothetical protein BGX30_012902 [Mortierella sp. GBA39]|nr:hypothetical protein BGX30_012902 [Mortierella sp. GBA39]